MNIFTARAKINTKIYNSDHIQCIYTLLEANVAILKNMTLISLETRQFLPQCHILSHKACHTNELRAIWHTAKHFGTHFVLYFAKAKSAPYKNRKQTK